MKTALRGENHPRNYTVLYILDLYRGFSREHLDASNSTNFNIQFERNVRWLNLDVTSEVHEATFEQWLKQIVEQRLPGVMSIAKKIGLEPSDCSLVESTVKLRELVERYNTANDCAKPLVEPESAEIHGFTKISRVNSKLWRAEHLNRRIRNLKHHLSLIAQLVTEE